VADASFVITLPLPPSANATYATTATGARQKTAAARGHRTKVKRLIERALTADLGALAVFDRLREGAWWGLYLDVFLETPRRRDLDNVLKPTVDALASAFGITDSTLVDIHLSKHLDPLAARIEATIVALEDWALDRNEFRVVSGP
jgi:crossover junction endodeoxyribonuclease RusA